MIKYALSYRNIMPVINPIKNNKKDTENKLKPLKIGETVEGIIVGVGRSSVFLDLGIQGAGVIFGKEFNDAKYKLEKLQKGDKVSGKVIELENEDGYIELSASEASKEIMSKDLQKKKEQGEIIKVKIIGANKGGLLADIGDLSGFLPVSQLSPAHYPQIRNANQTKILQELQKFIGQEFEVKILEFIPKDNKLVLSEKAKESKNIENILKNYKEGDIVEGAISKIVSFGVFIKFPVEVSETSEQEAPKEIEGLVHISELDWEMVDNPGKLFQVGQEIKAKIVKIAQGRISLSIKALKQNPWDETKTEYKKGDKIKGEIVKINPFGILVKLPSKIQGLCHISEFDSKEQMKEQMKISQMYDFEILSIDAKEHKILLKPIFS